MRAGAAWDRSPSTRGPGWPTCCSTVDALRADIGGGRMDVKANIPLGTGATTNAQFTLAVVDAGLLIGLLPSPPDVRLATALSGILELKLGENAETTVVWANLETLPSARGGGLALRGPLKLTTENGRWRAVFDQRTGAASRIQGTLAGRVATPLTASTIDGPVVIDVPQVAAAMAELRAARLVTARLDDIAGGPLRAQLTVGGTVAAPVITGPFTADNVAAGRIGPATLTGRLAYRNNTIAIEGATIALPEGDAKGDVTVNLRTQALGGTVSFALRSLAGWIPASVPLVLEGPVEGVVQLAGRATQPMASGTVRGGSLLLAGQRFDRFDAAVALSPSAIRVDQFDAAAGAGTLTASGSYELSPRPPGSPPRFTINLDGKQLPVRDLRLTAEPLPISGTVNLAFKGEGTLDNPVGTGSLRIDQGRYADQTIGRGEATFDLKNRRLTLAASLPDLRARIDGFASVTEPYAYSATVRLDAADLGDLVTRSGTRPTQKIEGTVSAAINLTGQLRSLAGSSADAQIERVVATVDGVPVTWSEGARLRYAGGILEATGVNLRSGATGVRVDGRFGSASDRLSLSIDGTLADLQRIVALFPGAPPVLSSLGATGTIRANLNLSGTRENPTASGTVELLDVRLALEGHPPLEHVSAKLRLTDGVIDVDSLIAQWQGATVEGRGTVPLQLFAAQLPATIADAIPRTTRTATLDARITGLTQQALVGYASAETIAKLTASVAARLALTADRAALDALRGFLELDEATIRVSGVTIAQRDKSRVEFADGRAQFRGWQWTGPTTSLELDGSVGLSADPALALTVGGDVDLRLVSLFVPVATGGRAGLRASLGGSLAHPSFDGEIALSGAEMRLAEPRVVVSGVSGTLQLTRDRLTGQKLTGTVNGGPLTMTVDVRHANFAIESGRVTLTATGVPIEAIDGLRTEVESDLRLELGPTGTALRGTVTVARGGYREPLTIIGQVLQRMRERTLTSAPTGGQSSALADIALDVAIVTREDVIVSNNVADLALSLDVRLVGTLARPGLVGRSQVRDGGTIVLAGNVFQIESGRSTSRTRTPSSRS